MLLIDSDQAGCLVLPLRDGVLVAKARLVLGLVKTCARLGLGLATVCTYSKAKLGQGLM